MKRLLLSSGLIWVASFGLFGTCAADTTLVTTVKIENLTASGAPSLPTEGSYTTYYKDNLALTKLSDGSAWLFDFNKSAIAILDTSQKTYTVLSLNDFLSRRGKTSNSATLQASTTQSSKTIATMSANLFLWSAKVNGAPSTEPTSGQIWMTTATVTGTAVQYAMPQMAIAFSRSVSFASLFGKVQQAQLVPLSITCVYPAETTGTPASAQPMTVSAEVTSANTAAIDDSVFVIPSDYTQVKAH